MIRLPGDSVYTFFPRATGTWASSVARDSLWCFAHPGGRTQVSGIKDLVFISMLTYAVNFLFPVMMVFAGNPVGGKVDFNTVLTRWLRIWFLSGWGGGAVAWGGGGWLRIIM